MYWEKSSTEYIFNQTSGQINMTWERKALFYYAFKIEHAPDEQAAEAFYRLTHTC